MATSSLLAPQTGEGMDTEEHEGPMGRIVLPKIALAKIRNCFISISRKCNLLWEILP